MAGGRSTVYAGRNRIGEGMRPPVAASAFTSTKTFANLPCNHRQWRHAGHCAFLHGYSRSYTFHFACSEVDETHFVVDFGSLKRLKRWLEWMFDHTTLINADDPELPLFETLHARQVIDLRVMPNVSMEASARYVWAYADALVRAGTGGRAWCFAVEARENDKNSAFYTVARDGSEPAGPWGLPDPTSAAGD